MGQRVHGRCLYKSGSGGKNLEPGPNIGGPLCNDRHDSDLGASEGHSAGQPVGHLYYDLDGSVRDAPHLNTLPLQELEEAAGGLLCEKDGEPIEEVPARVEVRTRETTRVYTDTITPDQGGPLSGDPPAYKAHLCRPTRRCVCGYRPNMNRINLWKDTEATDWKQASEDF